MKKTLILMCILALLMSNSRADFQQNSINYTFNRNFAIKYMQKYYENYNKAYYNFNNIGGDCTNYASQVMRAALVPFTKRVSQPTYKEWYYYGSEWGYNRTSTWTSATEFRKFFGGVNNNPSTVSKSMTTYTVNDAILNFDAIWKKVLPGDIISHGHNLETSYHTQIVYDFSVFKKDILVSQHSENSLNRSLFDYLKLRQRMGQGDEYIFVICF